MVDMMKTKQQTEKEPMDVEEEEEQQQKNQTLEEQLEENAGEEDNVENPSKTLSSLPASDDDDDDDDDDDSEDSDSDSFSDDEARQNEKVRALEAELASNPSNYDAHLQNIKLLRKMAEVDKLRQAREAMNAVFPLTPAMWQEWAKDEAAISSGPEAFSMVERIYERGVFDYLSVPLWCDYLNYVQENDPSVCQCSPDGISKARNLFERAIIAAGLHVAQGDKIWEAYREFEQAILLTINENDIQTKESQVQRIRSIFHRQLSVPLLNLRATLLAYKAWEVDQGNAFDAESSNVDGLSSHVALAYQKAVEMYNARLQHEEQISKKDLSEVEKFQNFMSYLKFEKSMSDPVRVQVLYERAITEFPVSSDLWLDYTRYLDRTLKAGDTVRTVHSRSIKNCPWVVERWVQYLLSLERSRASEKDISAVFEMSLQCTFTSPEEYLDLFLTRVDGLRRRIVTGGEAESILDYSLIRETFKYASDYLSTQLKNTDSVLRLHAYWACLELNIGKDLVAARGVWESLLKTSGSMLEAWQGYIAMEIKLGHIHEARSIYKRCYSKRFAGTGSEDICHSWLRFEREFGTLEDFDHAVQKVTPRLEELQLFRMQQESKAFAGSADQRENTPVKKSSCEKRKGRSGATDEQSLAKRQKKMSQMQRKEHDNDGDAQNANKAEEVDAKAEKIDSSNVKQLQDSDQTRTKVYSDQCTAFISNLPFNANNEDIRRFFSDVGGVVSIRILHDKFTGKSRGLAYVDFSDDQHLAAAVAKNKQMLLKKRLSIARSDPKKRNHGAPKQEAAHASNQHKNDGGSTNEESSSRTAQPPASTRKQYDNIQLKGKNTFAMPRNVMPLGRSANKPKNLENQDGEPKSNEEFRKMFIKD